MFHGGGFRPGKRLKKKKVIFRAGLVFVFKKQILRIFVEKSLLLAINWKSSCWEL